MYYQLLIDGKQIYSGSELETNTLFFLIGIIFLGIISFIWNKIKVNNQLKYEFITIIAHKFRTPLTSIKWLTEAMMRNEIDSYKKQSLNDIDESNQKLIDLTGTLVELTESINSGKASYTFEKISITSLVRNTSNSLKSAFHEKNIFLSILCPDEDIFVKADKTRLEFVIQTILDNARIYTTPGRNVDVSVTHTHFKSIITVTDHGIGIDKKDLPKIFSKFYRTENAKTADTEGFGIGLYLANSIIQKHRGKIEVFSEGQNMGTTFTISLPRIK